MHDDDDPRPAQRRLTPPVLDSWGVEELRLYIAELQTEVTRAEAAITRKQGQRGIADSFFRT